MAIVGSGFGGSLTALLLQRIGLSAVLIDRTSHPRFAIGESSTPNADLSAAPAGPRLRPAATRAARQVRHLASAPIPRSSAASSAASAIFTTAAAQRFSVDPDHTTELLVAASPDDEHSDTHWLRSDVDAFLAREAASSASRCSKTHTVTLAPRGNGWRLSGTQHEEAVQIDAEFIIDGTGEFGLVPRTLGIASRAETLATNSRTVFGHFREPAALARTCCEQSGGVVADHPFPCDHAALHQVLDDGWMYQLGFNNGVVSAGFVLDANDCPLDESVPIQAEWDRSAAALSVDRGAVRRNRNHRACRRPRPHAPTAAPHGADGRRQLGSAAAHRRLHRPTAQHGHRPDACAASAG